MRCDRHEDVDQTCRVHRCRRLRGVCIQKGLFLDNKPKRRNDVGTAATPLCVAAEFLTCKQREGWSKLLQKTQKSKSKSTGVSPLQRVQHALAVEKYKNALLRAQVQVFRGRPMAAGTAGVGTMTSKSVPQTASQRISRPAAVPAADEGVSTARTPDPMSVVARERIVSGSDRKQPSFARGTAGVKSALPASVQPGGAGAVGTAAAASGHGPGSAATPPWPTVHSSAKDINAWAEGEIHNGKSPKETARDLSA